MKLSNKKKKYIRRHASLKSPESIAEDLRISARDVQIVLKRSADTASYKTISTLDSIFHWGLVIISFLAPLIFLRGIHDFANLPQSAFIQVGVVFLFLLWLIKCFISRKCLILKSPLNLPILAFVLWSLASLIYAHNKYEGFLLWMHWAASALMFFLVVNDVYEPQKRAHSPSRSVGTAGLASDRFAPRKPRPLGRGQGELYKNVFLPYREAPPFRAGRLQSKNGQLPYGRRSTAACCRELQKKRMVQLLTAIIFSGTLCALLGVVQHLFGLSWVPQARPPAATFANKNMAVHFIILTLPLIVGLLVGAGQRIWKQLLFLAPVIMIAYLVCAKSRAGFVTLAAESILITVLLVRADKRKIAVGLVTIGLAVSILVSLVAYKDFNVGSIELRKAIWCNTVEMIKDRPLIGLGLGNHKLFYPLYHRKVVTDRSYGEGAQLGNVHNDFIQAFAELGVVGMLLLGWMGLVLMRVALSLISSRYSPDVRFWSIGITTGIIGLLVIASFSFPFQRAIPPFVLMILLGILCSFYLGDNKRFYVITQRSIVLFACVVVFGGLIWLIRFHYLGIKCDRHFLQVTQLEELKNWQGVIAEGEKAYRLNPARLKILSYMGLAYLEMGNLRKGIDALQKVIESYPNSITDLFNIGLAYDKIGEDQKALETYNKLLLIKPDYSKVHNNVANIYLKQNNLDMAIKGLRLAARFDPKNSLIHFNIGIVEIQQRRYKEAARAFEKAALLKPGWNLAQRDSLSNSREEVVEHLRKELELNPRSEDAIEIRSLIELMEEFT